MVFWKRRRVLVRGLSTLIALMLGCGGSSGSSDGGSGGSGGSGGVGPTVPPGWTEPSVFPVSSAVAAVGVAINEASEAYLVFQEFRETGASSHESQDFGVRYTPGEGWGTPISLGPATSCFYAISPLGSTCHAQPKVGLTSDGTAFVAISHAVAPGELIKITGDTVAGAEPLPVGLSGVGGQGFNDRWADVIVLADDTIWVRGGSGYDETTQYSGGSWSVAEASLLSPGHALAVREDGTAIMIGHADSGAFAFSLYDGGWGAVQELDPTHDLQGADSVAVAEGDWAIVGWTRMVDGVHGEALACVIQGGACVAEQLLSTGGDAQSVDVAIDSNGNAHAAWIFTDLTAASGLPATALACDYTPASGWGAAYPLFDEPFDAPMGLILEQHATGTLGVVWEGIRGSRQFYILSDESGPLAVSPTPFALQGGDAIDLVVNGSGHAVVSGGAWGSIAAP